MDDKELKKIAEFMNSEPEHDILQKIQNMKKQKKKLENLK